MPSNLLLDGWASLDGGVDSGRVPTVRSDVNPAGLDRNKVAFAVNATFRGGRPFPRPGFNRITLNFSDATQASAFRGGTWQGASGYAGSRGNGSLIAAIGGKQFTINLESSFTVTDITIPGSPNPSNVFQVWFAQAEQFLVMQDGRTVPWIYDGSVARRALSNAPAPEIPVGTVMCYANGRLWITLPNRRTFVAGDLAYGDGSADSVLKFTENTFLNEGGAFSVPGNVGEIRSMRVVGTLDNSLGQGPMQVLTTKSICSANAPFDRTIWKDLTYPIQTVSMVNNGALNHNGTVAVNGDLWYRSVEGMRSFMLARRDFHTWNNSPMSREVNRILDKDTQALLAYGSGILFDNRLLETVSPVQTSRGIYHRGLAVLDFDILSGMTNKLPPAWEGLWTGMRILQIVEVEHYGEERAFAFALDSNDDIALWEITKEDRFDNGDGRIVWFLEFPSYTMNLPFQLKRLMTGDLWVDRIAGDVGFDLKYRSDGEQCWTDWHTWDTCAKMRDCDGEEGDADLACQAVNTYLELPQGPMKFPQPPDGCNSTGSRPSRVGYQFQPRLQIEGFCRLQQMRIKAHAVTEPPFEGCVT